MPLFMVEVKLTSVKLEKKNGRAGYSGGGGFNETGVKTEPFRQRGNTVLQHWTI